MDKPDVQHAAERATDNPWLERGARLGYLVSGVLHLVIAGIALRIAWLDTSGGGGSGGSGGGSGSADQSGAFGSIADAPGGLVVLWASVVGFAALAIVMVASAVARGVEGKERAKYALKGLLYAGLGYTALQFALGPGQSSKRQSVDFTASLMEAPGGRVLVGLLGLGVIGAAVYHVHKGWTRKFLRDLEEHPGLWATRSGRVGYIAKGAALFLVGGLFVVAALREQPKEATGLDGALRTLVDQPFGPVLLSLVALGIAAYGLYSFARARHARL